ncbi:MAG: gluconolactonase, partial [Actinobacteria bacterium]|nr:gluconolactonase [Actinomycetota bacterium]
MRNHRTILEGLWFGEGPRWHDDALYFSDMHGHRVVRTDLDGNATTVVELAHDEPSGLGWLPDGRLLVVAMETQRLHRLEADGTLVEHADLSGIARGDINDMIVSADGTAYVGDMGSKIHEPDSPRRPGQTIR